MMNIRHLEYFAVLAEELHFRRSAERLGITQAPLSLAIQALEESLGARLFHRTRRSVSLTEAGIALAAQAPAILAHIEHARESVWQTVSGEVGRLRVGFTNASSLSPVFPQLIHAYRKQRPKVQVQLHELPSSRQLDALEAREIDVALLRLDAQQPAPSSLVLTPLVVEPLVLAMHAGHPLAKAAKVRIADLRDEAFIAYPRSAGVVMFAQIHALCAKRGFEPKIVQEAQQASTLIGLTATGLGVTIVPASLNAIAVPGVVFRDFADTDTTTTLYIGHRYGDANSRVKLFVELAGTLREQDGGGGPATSGKKAPARKRKVGG
ncbi:HTH-type transcriptional regulator BenM [Pandoraea iniqua]|uniref:LysR family transcriptional regulator n=1 Tax=Pandoraea iniqua TaxID=2508288 RepID=UPI001242AD5C|nr:LysR family transcriptional regulator [Pandoraea iniqua]VVD93287.1 HTH-type transcriptional regulator BenM [Pandoraea iniqua]